MGNANRPRRAHLFPRRAARHGLVVAAVLLALAGLTWANFRFARANPGGNDFLPRWVGARAFLLEGRSPYSDAVARRIQRMAYGRPARPGEDQMRVVYPLYALPFFAPYALIAQYTWARALWMTTLEMLLVAQALMALDLARWRLKPWGLAAYLLFALTWYHGLRALVNGNPVVLAAALLTAVPWLLHRGRPGGAGVALALSTIKPQVALLPVVGLLWWAWRQRRAALLRGFGLTMAGLLALSFALHPGWLVENWREIRAYPGYTPATTVQEALVEMLPRTAQAAAVVFGLALSAGLLVAWVRLWHTAARGPGTVPLGAYALTLVISQWVGIPTDPGNFVLLLLPLVLVAAALARRLGPWAAAGLLLAVWVGLWALFLATLAPGERGPQQHPILFVPLPALLLALGYGLGLHRQPKNDAANPS